MILFTTDNLKLLSAYMCQQASKKLGSIKAFTANICINACYMFNDKDNSTKCLKCEKIFEGDNPRAAHQFRPADGQLARFVAGASHSE